MDLTELAGSQAPNALALLCVALLTVAGFATHDQLRWGFVLPTVALVATVIGKNWSYAALVSGAEGSVEAHRGYAEALMVVITVQVAIGVGLLFLAAFSNRVRWLAVLAALATAYAATCMMGWWQVYATAKAARPVRYELWTPLLHWAILAGLTLAAVAAIISLARRRRPRTS